ncbi:MAG: hypothetical protein WCN21_14475 [Comamonadaceae bacterium]
MSLVHRLRQVGVGSAVVGLHLLLVLAWSTFGNHSRPPQTNVAVATVAVWLPTLSTEPVTLAHPQRASPRDLSVRRDRDDPERSSAAPLAAPPTDDAEAMPSAALTATEVPKALGSALNLALSREAQKFLAAPGLAARSLFHGRLPATVESQIAEAAAETGPWTEERIDSDHIRLRRGTTCVMLTRPRIVTIDPFTDSLRRIPWAADVSQCR